MVTAAQWFSTPPEVNASELMAGDHMASTLKAAAGFESLAALFAAEGISMATTATTTAAGGWQGLGGMAMTGTALTYSTALELLVAWLQTAATAGFAVAEAYAAASAAMIPAPVCTTNRVEQAEAVATNFLGIRTPEIIALDTEYFGHFWTNNAALMSTYEAVVTPLLATLTIPAPLAPLTASPAGPVSSAAAIAQAAGNSGAQLAQSASLDAISEVTNASPAAAQLAAAPAQSGSALSSMTPMMSMMGSLPQMASQPVQMLGQFPQMLSQFPQMATGLLGPLTSAMGTGLTPEAAALPANAATAPAPGGATPVPAGAMPVGGAPAGGVNSTYTRPSGSFAAPDTPRLPAGWGPGEGVATTASTTTPAQTGTGGLYGAPPPSTGTRGSESGGRDEGDRTMQLVHSTEPGGRRPITLTT